MTFDAVFFTAVFFVPGFIWSAVLSMLIPRSAAGKEVRFLEFLTLSCINSGLWSLALIVIFKSSSPGNYAIVLFVIMVLSPVTLGLLSARFKQQEFIGRFLMRLGYRTIQSSPTAWDWHFSRSKPYWLVVTLKNGLRIYGLFGERSFAGDDPERRDLYLEATFRLLEIGEWAPVEDTSGTLIMADQISTIDFRKFSEVNDE